MVGDPFSGKTQVLQVLAETLNVLTDRGYDDENVNKVPVSKQTYNKRSISLSYKTSLIPRLLWSIGMGCNEQKSYTELKTAQFLCSSKKPIRAL